MVVGKKAELATRGCCHEIIRCGLPLQFVVLRELC
jgi:hypothetical protein